MLHINIELFKILLKESKSINELIIKLGYKSNASAGYRRAKIIIKKYNLDTSHLKGQGWNKGNNCLTDKRVGSKHSLEEIFKENSNTSRGYIRNLILKNNLLKYECDRCHISEWQGEKISLDLDHKNGIRNDHRLENLHFLCPNCHSLTHSYKGRNIQCKAKISDAEILDAAKICPNIRQVLLKIGMCDGYNYYRVKKLLEENNFSFPIKDIKKDERVSNLEWRKQPKLKIRKVINRPAKEELIELIKTKSFLTITKIFNLKSDNSIRNWCKYYGINYKEISPFSHTYKKLYPKVVRIKKPMKVFTKEQVLEIKKLLSENKLSQREIAKIYNVSHPTISDINTGKSYKKYLEPSVMEPQDIPVLEAGAK